MRHPFDGDNLDPAMIAADYVIAALGVGEAELVVAALSAGWLSRDEASKLAPLAAAIAYLGNVDVTKLERGPAAAL